jgi:hypothetical protein
VQAQQHKKDIMVQATMVGIISTRTSKETTAKVRAAT